MLLVRLSILAVAVLSSAQTQPISLLPPYAHYFLYHGKPLAIVSSSEHYGAVINGDFDYRRYLAALAADGMNYTRIFGGSYVEIPGKSFEIRRNTLAPESGRFIAPWKRSDKPGYAGGGNKFDLDQWNSEYFTRFHDFLNQAAKLGIIVEVTLFSSHYKEMHWDVSPFNSLNNVNGTDPVKWKELHTLYNGDLLNTQERYTRKLVREANGFDNVIFEIQNEPYSDRPVPTQAENPYQTAAPRDRYPRTIDLADPNSIAWQTMVASWISSEESKLSSQHLIAQNCCNSGAPIRGFPAGLAIMNFHYAYPAAVIDNYGMGMALVYDESGFLGAADEKYVKQAWNFMMAGGSGFNGLDYSYTVGKEDGTDNEPNGPGGGGRTLRKQLRVLSEFLNAMPLAHLIVDKQVVKEIAGGYARALSAQSRDYAIYFEGAGPTKATLGLPAGEYTGQWINTKTGAIERAEKFTHTGGEWIVESPAFESSIALRLKRT